MVLDQLERSGYRNYLSVVAATDKVVTGTINRLFLDSLIAQLKADGRFAHGALHGLHADVGPNRIDFRSHRGEFGKRSLQIVISRETAHFFADTDAFSPYEDIVGFVGHAGEVVRGWLRRFA